MTGRGTERPVMNSTGGVDAPSGFQPQLSEAIRDSSDLICTP
jgi:hypothetical protein